MRASSSEQYNAIQCHKTRVSTVPKFQYMYIRLSSSNRALKERPELSRRPHEVLFMGGAAARWKGMIGGGSAFSEVVEERERGGERALQSKGGQKRGEERARSLETGRCWRCRSCRGYGAISFPQYRCRRQV